GREVGGARWKEFWLTLAKYFLLRKPIRRKFPSVRTLRVGEGESTRRQVERSGGKGKESGEMQTHPRGVAGKRVPASYLRDMGVDGFGSSIVIALAALLWLVYLVPTWFRRKEYLSTERNAVRLQQTLRIVAETSELPQQVRVETSARAAAAQEKLLRAQMQRERAIAKAQLTAADRASTRQLAEKLPALAAEVARGSVAS